MKKNNQFCNEVKTIGENAREDVSAKSLLKYRAIIARILKGCVREYKDISLKKIETEYIQKEDFTEDREIHGMNSSPEKITGQNTESAIVGEGKVYFDLIFYAYLPNENELTKFIINLEPQDKFNTGYPLVKRGFYYDARLISGQYGTEFTNQEYGKIKKVISIWICLNPSQYCMDTINRYRITEENVVGNYKLETSDYDVMEVIIVCLHDGEKKRKHSKMIDMLSVLFSDKLNGEKKQKILKKDYKLKMTQEYKEVVNSMCYITDVYNRKLKEQQEEFDEKLVNQQEEFTEKLANQQEEFDEKLAEEKRKTVLNMLENNLGDDLIISCTGVTLELLAEIKAGM
ncbi:MAG: hypothetical protein Q4D76_14660 [Oscillospiraceae bacterium]|nr:hypothetical protein [Oscillospiraceae bacterium]